MVYLTSTETVRLIMDGLGVGAEKVGRWGKREIIYTYRYTVTSRMTPALRWSAMKAILMFH